MLIRHWLPIGLAGLLVVALLMVSAGRTDAQTLAPLDFPSLSFTYRDVDGPGTAAVTNQGPDPASGGARIAVVLTQNGRTFQGHGFVRQVEPISFVGAFWLTDGGDTSYLFVGTFVRGFAGWSAQGRYELVDTAGISGEWTMSMAPCPAC